MSGATFKTIALLILRSVQYCSDGVGSCKKGRSLTQYSLQRCSPGVQGQIRLIDFMVTK